jgi:anti-anti-sigma factor
MEVAFTSVGEVSVFTLQGKLDAVNQKVFGEQITKKTADENLKTVVLDLSGLDYISSAGFREFFMLGRQMQRTGGKMAVCALQPMVAKVFEIARFQTAYPVCADQTSAIAAVSTPV